MTINDKGNVVDYKIAETVICVDRRMTYTSVKKILEEQDEEECKKYEEFVPMFQTVSYTHLDVYKRQMQLGAR